MPLKSMDSIDFDATRLYSGTLFKSLVLYLTRLLTSDIMIFHSHEEEDPSHPNWNGK
jgi:hypothetical protein